MKNFDIERAKRNRTREERTFQIGGEVFTLKNRVRPEALAGFDDLTKDSTVGETMAAWDEMFLTMVEPEDDAAGRYARLRTDDADPLGLDDLQELVEWMLEEVGGNRPTTPSSASTPTPAGTGTPSTGVSSLPVAAASTA
jgi:hypothetical protein